MEDIGGPALISEVSMCPEKFESHERKTPSSQSSKRVEPSAQSPKRLKRASKRKKQKRSRSRSPSRSGSVKCDWCKEKVTFQTYKLYRKHILENHGHWKPGCEPDTDSDEEPSANGTKAEEPKMGTSPLHKGSISTGDVSTPAVGTSNSKSLRDLTKNWRYNWFVLNLEDSVKERDGYRSEDDYYWDMGLPYNFVPDKLSDCDTDPETSEDPPPVKRTENSEWDKMFEGLDLQWEDWEEPNFRSDDESSDSEGHISDSDDEFVPGFDMGPPLWVLEKLRKAGEKIGEDRTGNHADKEKEDQTSKPADKEKEDQTSYP